MEVPFDPEEENRRQLALSRAEPWPAGPLPDPQLDIAPEQTAELAANEMPLPGAIGPNVRAVMDENGEPPLPVADESLPPVSQPGAGRRSAAAMLQDIPEPGSGAGMAQAGGQAASRRSAAALLAEIPEAQPAASVGLVDAVGNAIQRGLWMSEMGDEFDKAAPDGRRVVDIQGRMRGLPASPEYMAAMNDKLTPMESWMAFKSAPVKVMAELLGESMGGFLPQMIEKAPARVAIGAGAGAAAGAPFAGIGAGPGARAGAQAGFAQATGAASFTLEQAGGILEALEKAGVPMDDPQAMAQAVQDPERMQLAREFAAKKAVPIAMFDTGSALLAGRLLGGAKGLSRVQKIIRGGGEMLAQAILGGGGEVAGQVAQTGGVNSWRSVAAEIFAGIPQDSVEVAAGAIFNSKGGGQARGVSGKVPASAAPATVDAPQTAAPVVDDVFGGPEAGQPSPRSVNFTVPDDTGTMPEPDMGADVFAGVPRREPPAAEPAVPTEEEAAAGPEPPQSVTGLDPELYPVVEVPVQEIVLSRDVPNFKADAGDDGVVRGNELQGKYVRLGTGAGVLWERMDGTKELITGRHRFALGKRAGEKTLPMQIAREADGFTLQDALTLDAEANIRDGQGTIRDYANYFRNTTGINEQGAMERGLLSRAPGVAGFRIGKGASDALYTAFANRAISAEKAAAIAGAAPGNEAVQRAAMARSRAMTAPQLEGFTRVVAMRQQAAPDAGQQDLFGADDSALNEAEAMSKAADAKARAIQDRITAARSAAKRPEAAKSMGVDVRDPAATDRMVAEMQAQVERYRKFYMHPDIVAELNGRAPADAQPAALARDPKALAQLDPGELETAMQFGHRKGGRNLLVMHENTIYGVNEQRNGKLTADPEQVRQRIHREAIEGRIKLHAMDKGDASYPGSGMHNIAKKRLQNPGYYAVSAAAVDAYGIKLPDDFVKRGDVYAPMENPQRTINETGEGNLFGEREMPFNLAGQTDASSLTPAEQAQAAKDAEARAEAEGAQGDLFGAKQRIRQKLTGEAGGIDASIIQDLADYGVRFYRAGMDYAAWAAKMVNEFGRGVARFLRDAWDRMVRAYHNSRFSDTTGAVGDVRPKARQLEEKAKRNEALAPEVRARLGSEYIPITLNAQAEGAKGWIEANGLDAAKLRMARLNDAGVTPTPLDFAIGIEAAGMLSAAGDHAGAAEIVGTMSRRATSLGQTISVLAMMARLTPEGIVLYGQDLTQRYITALPDDAQARIRALQDEVAKLKETLDKLRLDMANHTLAAGEHAGENVQTRLRRKQRAKVEAEMPPGTPGTEVTAEVRKRTQRMSRDMRAVLLSDATRAEAQKLIAGILVEQGNMSPAEADAMAAAVTKAFYEFLKGAKRKLVAAHKAKAGTRRSKFAALEERLRQGDVSDADMLAELAKLAGVPTMTPALARELQELARQYAKATDPDVKLVLGATMFEKAHSLVPAEIWAKVRGAAYLAMLFSPKTWIRNVLGNEIQWIVNVGMDAAVTWFMDPLMSVFTGERTTSGVHLGPRLKALAAPISDVRRGYEWNKAQNPQANFRQNLRAGVHHLRVLSKLTTQNKYDMADVHSVGARIFSSRLMRMLEGTLAVALGAGDRAFWMSQFKTSMAQLEEAARKNGEWTGQPTPEMIETAFAEAAYAIYQNPNVLSKSLTGIRGALNKLSTGGKTDQFGLGTSLLAFSQVPGSIAMRGLVDWSPLGMIRAFYKGMRGILYATSGGKIAGKFDQAGFNKAFAQSVIGTGGMYAAGYFLYNLGIITASREDDEDLEAMRRASGLGAYRINLSALKRALLSGNWHAKQQPADGDLIVSYDWAQPVAITLAAGAELAAQVERAGREGAKKGLAEKAGMAAISFAAGAKSLEELPLLSGLSSFARAWGLGGPLKAVTETVAGLPSMFVPQLVRQATQLNDNMVRETAGSGPVQKEFMRVLANIPGVSTGFPIKFDTMGRAIERYQYGGNTLFNVMLNPSFTSRFKSDPVLNEMGRLMDATGQTSMMPRKASRLVSVNGQQMELNNEQLAAYQYYAGNLTMAYFTWRLASPAYARMSDEAKVKVLTNDLTDIHAAVRSAAFGHDVRRLTSKQRSIRNNLLTSPLGQSQPPR